MDSFLERVLNRAGLTEEDLAECASVNLPEPVRPLLDLSPAQIVGALGESDVESLRESRTLWTAGWEPNDKLRRLLASLRGALNSGKNPPKLGKLYRCAVEQLERSGRIGHAKLLSWKESGADGTPTTFEQRIALRLRGKIKGCVAPVEDLADLKSKLREGADES